MSRRPPYDLRELRSRAFERESLRDALLDAARHLSVSEKTRRETARAVDAATEALGCLPGSTLEERWRALEDQLVDAPGASGDQLRRGARLLVLTRAARPAWATVAAIRIGPALAWLCEDDPLLVARRRFVAALDHIGAVSDLARRVAPATLAKMMLWFDYERLEQFTEDDLRRLPRGKRSGLDTIDAALCQLGVLARSPQRGFSRHRRARSQPTPAELLARRPLPERFREVTRIYLEQARLRAGYAHSTIKARTYTLTRFWRFVDERFPELGSPAEVRREHALAYRDAMIEASRATARAADGPSAGDDRLTPYADVGDVRVFFHDACTWAQEEGSPLAGLLPTVPPLKGRDLAGPGFRGVLARQEARMHSRVLDLERELPGIRAHALSEWRGAEQALRGDPGDHRLLRAELTRFWDWALLELFVQSGVRIEEALELTALDVLRRQLSDGRTYYLLHIKPAKNGRARLIPIGDGLGRVIAEIVRHVRGFYGSEAVPAIETWDPHENRLRPRAPYLLQGAGHPRGIAQTTVRERLRGLSLAAGARRADGSPLSFAPHDGRRVFASEHLNNNTPVHVIAALLGHAALDTVMVYAKLYPTTLVEEYRKAVRGSFLAAYGDDALSNPSAEEWAELAESCSLRDMGTHLCALPTGDHCSRGLVCLGCSHAQPKRSAAPVFARMLSSHTRQLAQARERGEPAGQIAARELEVERISSAHRRSRELAGDVAEAIEGAAL